ncbi:hypothetical protein F4821DRAFT_174180 [Hypoxylon rubiginosum]|uniref:Uncharacterized protein n=1 Tax=Hypoxylon rubiginosum TaxID=110542 RepID=A0ACC0DH19_9PEZI|nr:hypothetical protein F4821DRAFT_174180 [Hypoxylon rubiginosum]
MLTQSRNDSASMEPTTTHRNAILSPSFPIQTPQPQSSRHSISRLATPLFQRDVGNRFNISGITEQLPYSPVSLRSGSSFSSQGSSAESWDIVSTEPSSPRTPKSKHEFDDAPRLDLIPLRRGSPKRKCESPDEYSKKIKLPPGTLPSIYRLLPTTDEDDHHVAVRPTIKSHLQTPTASPEPNRSHIISILPASPPSDDPITQWLNLRRMESGATKGVLPQPEGLSLNINLDFRPRPEPISIFYREKQQYTPQQFRGCYRPRQQPLSPPRGGGGAKKKRAKSKNDVHNNIKYAVEETDYIRFNKYEMKLSWEENRRRFREKFPMADAKMNREKQGIQSVHYRDNANVPLLVERGRVLVFLPNGHVEGVTKKVRDQGEDKPYYSLTYLYPERALLYDWVPPKAKHIAVELVKERRMQKEHARREAFRRGDWVEKPEPGTCACCIKNDRIRDTHKRAVQQQQQQSDYAVPVKPEPACKL